ncbi:MAG: YdiU family protein [Pseudohongiella nitratireducens]|nr:YdiU family protein [Pseudohongiella nitratireducens]MDF1622780.1 YdiU family protein [Pseudohongiella nitratireducens]
MSLTPSKYTAFLPGQQTIDHSARQTPGVCWSATQPTVVSQPTLIHWNTELADEIGLPTAWQDPENRLQWLSGNALPPGSQPYAMCYGGHQFGQWAGQLGDGRVINLGDVSARDGQNWTLQLKGAGPTAYSRFADGRAVLRSSVREYLCSEAMACLGIPTTRALSLVLTGDSVVRDVFYDGNPAPEQGAIVCRAAPSFLRFGHFELAASLGDSAMLKQLIHYALSNTSTGHVPFTPDSDLDVSAVLAWFETLCEQTLKLAVDWARVGFVHGVLNTDNMSAMGLTIDYGPYGWLDAYDPSWTPNTTDAGQRRYRFENQGRIVQWNLYQLANALAVVIPDHEALQSIVESLPSRYESLYQQMMCHKLGLEEFEPRHQGIIKMLENLLQSQETDMTIFFDRLKQFSVNGPQENEGTADSGSQAVTELQHCVNDALYDGKVLDDNLPLYRQFALEYRSVLKGTSQERRHQLMSSSNPAFILRNYLVQQAIESLDGGDQQPFDELFQALRSPYRDQGTLSAKRPEWARNHPGCTALSCSS